MLGLLDFNNNNRIIIFIIFLQYRNHTYFTGLLIDIGTYNSTENLIYDIYYNAVIIWSIRCQKIQVTIKRY